MSVKLSVSVPDELWEAAKAQRPDLNPSHLIQEALECWQRRGNGLTSRPSRPPETEDQFNRVRDRVARQMREEFERGYSAALEVAERLEWETIALLVEIRFDVKSWADGFARSAQKSEIESDNPLVVALVQALGSLISKYGRGAFTPTPIYLRGFVQAMRDLWDEASRSMGEASV